MDMVIDRACVFDHPQIEAMRQQYFTSMGRDFQRRPPETTWFVAREGEILVGCYSILDITELRQRWVSDFYLSQATPRLERITVALKMWSHLKMNTPYDAEIFFHVDPRNEAFMRCVARRGGVEPVGILCRYGSLVACPQR